MATKPDISDQEMQDEIKQMAGEMSPGEVLVRMYTYLQEEEHMSSEEAARHLVAMSNREKVVLARRAI